MVSIQKDEVLRWIKQLVEMGKIFVQLYHQEPQRFDPERNQYLVEHHIFVVNGLGNSGQEQLQEHEFFTWVKVGKAGNLIQITEELIIRLAESKQFSEINGLDRDIRPPHPLLFPDARDNSGHDKFTPVLVDIIKNSRPIIESSTEVLQLGALNGTSITSYKVTRQQDNNKVEIQNYTSPNASNQALNQLVKTYHSRWLKQLQQIIGATFSSQDLSAESFLNSEFRQSIWELIMNDLDFIEERALQRPESSLTLLEPVLCFEEAGIDIGLRLQSHLLVVNDNGKIELLFIDLWAKHTETFLAELTQNIPLSVEWNYPAIIDYYNEVRRLFAEWKDRVIRTGGIESFDTIAAAFKDRWSQGIKTGSPSSLTGIHLAMTFDPYTKHYSYDGQIRVVDTHGQTQYIKQTANPLDPSLGELFLLTRLLT